MFEVCDGAAAPVKSWPSAGAPAPLAGGGRGDVTLEIGRGPSAQRVSRRIDLSGGFRRINR